MRKTTVAQLHLTRTHRILIGVVVAGAVVIAGIGFAGSYAAVRALALQKGFGGFSLVFPIGIDAGICVLLALDLLLTWLRIPFPLLRQTAWLLTAATIAFNGAAAWPDPLGVGMHAVIPILFVVTVEAARHAVGRIADITADRHMEGVRITRWLLSPVPTFKLWRRMKLWELRSYEQAVGMEQDRLIYQARLQARYGRAWRRKAPVEALMPLRLARIGVPLTQTASHGLTAAGLEPVLLRPAPSSVEHEVTVERDDTLPPMAAAPSEPAPLAQPEHGEGVPVEAYAEPLEREHDYADTRHQAPISRPAVQDNVWDGRGLFEAYRSLAAATGTAPDAETFAAHLADAYGIRDVTTGAPVTADEIRLLLAPFTELPAATVAGLAVDDLVDPDDGPVSPAPEELVEPHPFFAPRAEHSPAPVPAGPATASTASTASTAPEFSAVDARSVPRQHRRDVPSPGSEVLAESSTAASGAVTARLPEQESDVDDGLTETERQVRQVALWLDEADAEGEKLAGAEVARLLGVSPSTGQRRLSGAVQYREEHRRLSGRGHLRSITNRA
ncbi:DUF2637 domain-containing protein [Streptomyces sp. NPDC051577]|uniref:DUF2637 domain-containing protein n=1 Tax=Streptomyces sp. NPDC051577 TaxID=3155166 RepID=UPI0034360EC1